MRVQLQNVYRFLANFFSSIIYVKNVKHGLIYLCFKMVIGSHAHDQVMKTLHITSATVWFTDVLSFPCF